MSGRVRVKNGKLVKVEKRSRRNDKRQPGSVKVWLDESSGMVWESVDIHHGRTTQRYRGPLGKTLDAAHSTLSDILKTGV